MIVLSRLIRGAALWSAALVLVTACGVSSPAVNGTWVPISGRARVVVPKGWSAVQERGDLRARPPAGTREGVRIDLAAVPRKDYGVTRDVKTTLAAVRVQAAGAHNATLGAERTAQMAERPAGALEWSYDDGGARIARRHWVVELAESTVHVSCLGPQSVPAECDAVVASLEAVRK